MSTRNLMIVCLLACATPSLAAPKTEVAVTFELRHYERLFTAAQLGTLPARAAKRLADDLGAKIRFLAFAPGGSGAFRLKAAIRPHGPTGGLVAPEIGLDFTLEGPGLAANTEQFVFRPPGDSNAIDVENFVVEIGRVLVESDYRGKLRTQLQRVPIAQQATVSRDPEGWLLPVPAEELCIDSGRLEVANETQRSGLRQIRKLSAEYAQFADGRVLCTPTESGRFQLEVLGADEVTVKGVWFVEGSDCALGGR